MGEIAMPQWTERTVAVDELIPFELNPREISDKDYRHLRDSLQQDGYHQRIIATQNKYSGNVWAIAREHQARADSPHPHQKPIEIIERAFEMCLNGNIVLDPFGGSGSTLIACEKLQRQCRMMELDPIYCDVIVKRWQAFTGKQARLESTGEMFIDREAA